MQTTEVLGLKKPDTKDFYDVNVQNDNSDALDALFEKDANGTVVAKNASKLDGHGAEYFATKNDITVNLLNPTLATTTLNGVTCTNNGDGTYTVNGTATAEVQFVLCSVSVKSTSWIVSQFGM